MRSVSRLTSYTLIAISTILIMVAVTAQWFTTSFYDEEKFVSNVVAVFSDEVVREAVSNEIIDEVFKGKPLLKQIATDVVKPAVAGLLDSNQLKSLIVEASRSFHDFAIARSPEDVVLDIVPLKAVIGVLSTLFGEGEFNIEEIPSRIVLIEATSIPNIHRIAIMMITIGPLAGFVAMVTFMVLVIVSKTRLLELQRIGGLLFAGSGLYLLFIPYLKNILVASTQGQYARTVMGKVYEVFANDLVVMLTYVFSLSVILFAFSYIVRHYRDLEDLGKRYFSKGKRVEK